MGIIVSKITNLIYGEPDKRSDVDKFLDKLDEDIIFNFNEKMREQSNLIIDTQGDYYKEMDIR